MNQSTVCRRPALFFGVVLSLLLGLAPAARAADPATSSDTVTYQGKEGAGKGKHIVFVAGANEYGPETGLPLLARILAERHGFTCTVVWSINPKTGEIDPNTNDNIPGLEALDHADLMFIFTRFRTLPDEQMKHVVEYVEAGKPVIGLRTATHGFSYPGDSRSAYKKFNWSNKDADFEGGFGRQVLGETWITHHAPNGKTSTRALFAPGAAESPLLRGIKDGEIWLITGEYGIRLPMLDRCKPLLMGQVVDGPKPTDKIAEGKMNDPLMPIAWTTTYSLGAANPARAFCATFGSDADLLESEACRRLMVNAVYWSLGLEDQIPPKANVDFAGEPKRFKKGMKPADFEP